MTTYSARLIDDGDRERWHRLWERSARLVQHHWRWVECAARGSGEPARIGIFTADGAMVAGFAFVERSRRAGRAWCHPAPASFAGMLHAEKKTGEELLRDLLTAASAAVPSDVQFAEVLFQPEISDIRGLLWQGWQAALHYNYAAPVLMGDAFLAQVTPKVRGHLKKAREAGLEVVRGKELLEPLLDTWELTRARKGVPNYVHPDAYRALVQWLGGGEEPGLGVEILAVRGELGGILDAGALLTRDGERTSYVFGASNPGAVRREGPTLIQVEAMRLAQSEGWSARFDWGGANTPSVAQFKKELRPGLETLALATRVSRRSRLLGALREFVPRRPPAG